MTSLKLMENRILVIKVNFGHLQHAVDCSKLLLSESLIACANITECRSLYNWEGESVDEDEVILSLKSTTANKVLLIQRIKELHSYDLPAILISEHEVNEEYYKWVVNCCKKS